MVHLEREVFPGWDWADLRWCMYCDEVRGESAMQFTEDDHYMCSVCLRRANADNIADDAPS